MDLSRLRDAIADDEPALEYITLPSKSNRTAKRGQLGVTEYHYRVDPGSALGLLFESGKRYSIGLGNRDLGIHHSIDGGHAHSSNADTVPSSAAEGATGTCKLVSNPHGGFAVFTVVENLTWPPPMETRMHLLGHPRNDEITVTAFLDPFYKSQSTTPAPTLFQYRQGANSASSAPGDPSSPNQTMASTLARCHASLILHQELTACKSSTPQWGL